MVGHGGTYVEVLIHGGAGVTSTVGVCVGLSHHGFSCVDTWGFGHKDTG